MLTLTPVVCVLAAIAFSKVFSIYLKDDSRTEAPDDEEDKEKSDKYYDKVTNTLCTLPKSLAGGQRSEGTVSCLT